MAQKLEIDSIWWRSVQPGEFYNIERHHQIEGGGGSLYIEIPGSIVPDTLDFLGAAGTGRSSLPIAIQASVVGQPDETGPIEFQQKSGGRMRIPNQNRQQPNSQRHPAWVEARGFPTAPDNVSSREEALPYFPEGGLRVYIAKAMGGDHYAGFTKGPRPRNMSRNHPMWELYGTGVGGVINAD